MPWRGQQRRRESQHLALRQPTAVARAPRPRAVGQRPRSHGSRHPRSPERLRPIHRHHEERMEELTGGLNLPGLEADSAHQLHVAGGAPCCCRPQPGSCRCRRCEPAAHTGLSCWFGEELRHKLRIGRQLGRLNPGVSPTARPLADRAVPRGGWCGGRAVPETAAVRSCKSGTKALSRLLSSTTQHRHPTAQLLAKAAKAAGAWQLTRA